LRLIPLNVPSRRGSIAFVATRLRGAEIDIARSGGAQGHPPERGAESATMGIERGARGVGAVPAALAAGG